MHICPAFPSLRFHIHLCNKTGNLSEMANVPAAFTLQMARTQQSGRKRCDTLRIHAAMAWGAIPDPQA
ncbi:hypothetical protein SXCC_02302 [Gluconacetobacter sp. SXCC-1]|nr:hypothetical protein SXCC_02302 [Gluconacetobacter sp. SXCC-1]